MTLAFKYIEIIGPCNFKLFLALKMVLSPTIANCSKACYCCCWRKGPLSQKHGLENFLYIFIGQLNEHLLQTKVFRCCVICSLEFYVPATSKVIWGWVSTGSNAHSCPTRIACRKYNHQISYSATLSWHWLTSPWSILVINVKHQAR